MAETYEELTAQARDAVTAKMAMLQELVTEVSVRLLRAGERCRDCKGSAPCAECVDDLHYCQGVAVRMVESQRVIDDLLKRRAALQPDTVH